MTWFTILKVDDRYKDRLDRFSGHSRAYNRRKAGRSGEIGRGKDTTRKSRFCDLCGQRKAARSLMTYGPHLTLCNACARKKYGESYKDKGKRLD
jgi:hypothetical protein